MLKRLAKAAIKAAGSPLIDSLGIYQRRIERLSDEPDCWTIVMYHRVIEDAASDPFRLGMCVRRERFVRQIDYLRRHFSIVGLADAVAGLAAGRPLPQRALSITFDDGYLDNLTVAFPLLKERGLAYSLFVPTGGLDTGETLWWDRVIGAFAGTRRSSLDLAEVGLAEQSRPVSLSWGRRTDAVTNVLGRIWDLPAEAMMTVVARIEAVLQATPRPAMRAERLSPAQLRRLHAEGVEIGAHSIGHPNLALAGSDQTRAEMHGSRAYLEALLQADVPGIAYPGGRMAVDTPHIARNLGFRYGLATRSGRNRPPLNLFELCRVGMPDSPMEDFRRAVSVTLGGGRHRRQTF